MKRTFATAVAGLAVMVQAGVPTVLHYQGRVTDGTNLVNGPLSLSLRLFDAPSGGNLLLEDSNVVTAVDGLYATQIGDQITTGHLAAVLAATNVFVEVAIQGTALSPREPVAATLFAVRANDLSALRVFADPVSPHLAGGHGSNVAEGVGSVVAGGGYETGPNRALGNYSAISGGKENVADGDSSVVIGGRFSSARGDVAIAGGENCRATSYAIALGLDNLCYSYASVISGGDDNFITNTEYATISGGHINRILGFNEFATISGGHSNSILEGARFAAIPGGAHNRAGGEYSFAAGRRAGALHNGTFVWADSTDAGFNSTAGNQFLIHASGGVGINTNAPRQAFHVNGNIEANRFYFSTNAWLQLDATGTNLLFIANNVTNQMN